MPGASLSCRQRVVWIASPVICGDKIFAVNTDQIIYVLDFKGNLISSYSSENYVNDGGQRAKDYSKSTFWTQPACNAANDTIYISSLSHYLYGFTFSDSKLHLTTEVSVNAALMSSPVVREDGKILIGDINGNLYLIDPSSGLGRISKQTHLDGGIWSKPVISHDGIYIGTQANSVYKLAEDLTVLAGPTLLDGPVMTKGIETTDGIIFMTSTGSFWKVGEDGKLISDTPLKSLADVNATGYFYSDAAVVGNELSIDGKIVTVNVIMAPLTQGSALLVSYDYDNKLPTLGLFATK